ncbi:MAG: hypothetical protein JRC60_07590 [Deltaproteobacteria bacterium]|nr:hypothetical protein [Deltaproteobacteria bacterium]
MENWLYMLGGAVGSIGAFWIIIRYVLSRLDSKLDVAVFNEFGKRIEASLLSGNKRFDRMEIALKENTAMLTTLCGEIGELRGAIKQKVE